MKISKSFYKHLYFVFFLIIFELSTGSVSATKTSNSIKDLHIVTRNDWGALPPVNTPEPYHITPISEVIISHTAGQQCYTVDRCSTLTRNIQNFHIFSQKWNDIGYNFLIGGEGSVYVGRGWNFIGAQTLHQNNVSIGIAFHGNFVNDEPTYRQVTAALELMDQGLALGKLTNNYTVYCQNQWRPTLSPGKRLVNIVKTWPRWNSDKPFYGTF